MKLASLQETVTVSGASPTVDVENTKVGARLSQEILHVRADLAHDLRIDDGAARHDDGPPGSGRAERGDVDRHGRARRAQLQPELLRRHRRHAAELRLDVLHGLRLGRGSLGRHRGDGRGNRRRRRREHQRHPEERRQHASRATSNYSITGKGYWDGFTGNNITDELRAQGITDPTLRKLNDFNANVGGPFIKDRLWWFGSFRNYTTIEATPNYTIVNADGSLTNPFDSNLRNYTASAKYQINKNNQLSAFWTYNQKFQPHRGAGVAQPNAGGHAATSSRRRTCSTATGRR